MDRARVRVEAFEAVLPCGSEPAENSRLEFLHRFNTTAAQGRVFLVRTHIRFPMPAAFAFLAVSV